MEQVLGIVGFSLGASLGISAVRSITDGSRSIVRDVFKLGIQSWDAVTSAGKAAAADASESASRGRARRRAEPRKIEIARN